MNYNKTEPLIIIYNLFENVSKLSELSSLWNDGDVS